MIRERQGHEFDRNEPDFMQGDCLDQRDRAYEWLKGRILDADTIELLISLDAILSPWHFESLREYTEVDRGRHEGFELAMRALGIATAVHRVATYDYFAGPVLREAEVQIEEWDNRRSRPLPPGLEAGVKEAMEWVDSRMEERDSLTP